MFLIFFTSKWAYAIQSNPDKYAASQPDGSRIELRIQGDEWFHYEQDLAGFTVIHDRDWYVYARRDEVTGRLVSSGLRVGIDNPAAGGLQPGILPSAAARAEQARTFGVPLQNPNNGSGSAGESIIPEGVSSAGVLKNLVIPIRWSDHTSRTLPSQSDINILMNNVGPHPTLAPTGSVRDVYWENSYGALSLESTVAGWVTSDNTEIYYADGNSGLTTKIHGALKYALTQVNATVDFRDFDQDGDGWIDSITFVHSGYGAEWGGNDAYGRNYVDRIWSHKWGFTTWTSKEGVKVSSYHISPAVWGTSGSAIGRIGVIAHETGHFLGLPDLYDTDSSSGQGIGSFGLMANSWGFDGSQKYPPHLSPWSKRQLGWLNPTVIDTPNTYTLHQAETTPEAFRINLGYPSGEYLLIENRQPAGFDGDMPQGGLVIWHIDESAGYNTEGYPSAGGGWTGSHYKIAVLQADGNYNLEKGGNRGDRYDTWHAAGVNEITVSDSVSPLTGPFPNTDAYQGNVFIQTGNRIYNITASGSTMNFAFEVAGAPTEPPAAPTNLSAAAASYERIDLSWSDNAVDESAYKVERSADGSSFVQIAQLPADNVSYSATGLSADTAYWFRVRASNASGDSAYSNTVSESTNPPPPPPLAPSDLNADPLSETQINLSWTDNSNDEDDFLVRRSLDGTSWVNVATLPAGTQSYTDTALSAETLYFYKVFAHNQWGESGSNQASAATDPPPAFVDAFADLDVFVSGTVSGNYTATFADDGNDEVITEVESGGKPSNRRSFLEHQWRFSNVRGGLAITLFINVDAPANVENDNFRFEASANGGASWAPLITIPNGSAPGMLYSAPLTVSDPGTYYVRVVDTDSTQGNRNLDSVRIDRIFLRTDLDPTDTPPTPPSNLKATALSSTEVELTWTDSSTNERGFRVLRSDDGSNYDQIAAAPVNAESFVDSTAFPNMTYFYKIEAYTASYTAESNVDSVTTPDGIALSASGFKQKGTAVVDLTWSGGLSTNTVDIWRSVNGGAYAKVTTIDNSGDGSFQDQTGIKGSVTLDYQVCSPAADPDSADVCSNAATLFF